MFFKQHNLQGLTIDWVLSISLKKTISNIIYHTCDCDEVLKFLRESASRPPSPNKQTPDEDFDLPSICSISIELMMRI